MVFNLMLALMVADLILSFEHNILLFPINILLQHFLLLNFELFLKLYPSHLFQLLLFVKCFKQILIILEPLFLCCQIFRFKFLRNLRGWFRTYYASVRLYIVASDCPRGYPCIFRRNCLWLLLHFEKVLFVLLDFLELRLKLFFLNVNLLYFRQQFVITRLFTRCDMKLEIRFDNFLRAAVWFSFKTGFLGRTLWLLDLINHSGPLFLGALQYSGGGLIFYVNNRISIHQ